MKTPNRLLLSAIIAFASLPGFLPAANTYTWTTGAGDGTGNWSYSGNWLGGVVPTAQTTSDTLLFGATTGVTTLNYDGAYAQFGIFTFDAAAPAYTINGNAFNGYGPGGFVVNSASNITQTINFNITANTNIIPVTGTGNLTLNGTFLKGGTYNPYLAMNGTGVLTIGGSGTLNTLGGTSPLTANSGTVVLARTYASGGFNVGLTLNGGTVKLGAAEQLRTYQGPTINGGTLDLNGYDNALGGNGAVVADGVSSGVNHNGGISQLTGLGGRVTNNAAGTGTNWLVINQNGGQQASYGGTISDGATAKVGLSVVANYNQSAFQALSGNNTYSGGTFIQHNYTNSGGRPETLSIANVASIGSAGNRNLTFKGGAGDANVVLQLTGTAVTNSNQFDGMTFTSAQGFGIDVADPNNIFTLGKNAGGTDITLAGAAVFEKLGAGTLEVKSALAYTNSTYLGGGTLKIDAQNGGALPSPTGSNLQLAGGSLYLLGKTSGTTTQTMGDVGLAQLNNYGASSGGASTITVDGNGGGGTTLALLTLPNSTSAGYTLNIKTLTGGTVTTTTTATTGGTTAANGMVGKGRILFTDASGVTDFAGISASGANRTIQAATYTAGLPTSGSTSTLNYSHTDNASVTTGESVNALKLTTSVASQALTITSTETLSLTSGALLFTGANDYSITGGTLKSTNSAATPDLIVHQYGSGALTIGSVIANGGTGASTLTKAGTGTLVLSGANTFTGSTFVTGGILSISSDNNIGGYNGTFANLTSTSGNSAVTSSAASLPAGFGVGSTMLGRTVNAIGGTSGAYTITLSGGANTTLSGGTASWVSATPTLYLYSGGVLQANGNITLQESNTGGTAGTTTVNRGITIGNSGGGFDVTGANTLTITGGIGATGMMTKSGTGTLVLSAANNLTGGITITDGTLKLNIANALTQNSGTATSSLILGSGSTARLQLNNYDASVLSLVSSNTNAIVENGVAGTKTLTVVNGADNTYAGKVQNGSAGALALTKSGGGTLTLSNAGNTFSGGITIYNGTVEGTATGTLGSGTITLADGTLRATGTFTNAITSWASVAGSATNAVSYLNNTIDTSVGNASFSGVFSNSGAVNKTGANTLTFGNAGNTYSGTLTATTGTVSFASMGSTAALVMAGGNFTCTGTTTVGSLAVNTSGGDINATAASLTINSLSGSGTFNAKGTQYGSYVFLKGTNSGFSGSINATGNFVLDNEAALGTNTNALTISGALTGNGTLTVASHRITLSGGTTLNGDMNLTGGLTGAGGIIVRSNPGTAVVIGGTTNDFAGPTSIYTDNAQNSTLRLGANNALPYGAGKGNLDLRAWGAGIATLDMGGYSQTVNGLHHINASGANTVIDNVSAGGTVTLTVGAGNATGYTFAGVIKNTSGTLNIEKTGTGTQILSGTNTYSGSTTVKSGKFTIDTTGTINGTSGVTMGTVSTAAISQLNYNSSTALTKSVLFAASSTGGTVSGSGTIDPALIVTSGNTYTPGEKGAAGAQTLTGGITFNSGSTFQWDIGISGGSETGHDMVTNTGGLAGSGAVFDVVLGTGAYTDTFWNANKSWNDVFSVGTLASVFSSITGTGVIWDSGTSRGNVAGEGYFTMSTNTLSWTAVPEPGSALAGLLVGAGLLRRRRNIARE